MEPASKLSSFIPISVTVAAQHISVANSPSIVPVEGKFPTSGCESDLLLNLALESEFIDLQGRVIKPSKIIEELNDEVQAVAATLLQEYEGSGIHPKKGDFPFIPVDFIPLIFELRDQLQEIMPPEIIGGGVSYLLAARFYIAYVMKRFKLTEEEATRILSYLIEQIEKRPADIDCRQYVDEEKNASYVNTPELFDLKISSMLTEVAKKISGIKRVNIKTIVNHYYQKLFLVTAKVKFGMARFGKFLGGIPLEYIVVPGKMERPYITFHKSVALVFSKDPNLAVSLKFYADASINPETAIFQDVTLILDTLNFDGMDWRCFFSCMAESTRRGARALNPVFFDNLWAIVVNNKRVIMNDIEWATKNHLIERGESVEKEKELLIAYHWNILLYLIDHNQITDEAAKMFLQKHSPSVDSLNFLHDCLKIPSIPLQTKLAWFRLGMWIRMGHKIPKGSLSTNYGTICHRIVYPHSQAVVWLPIDLARSCKIIFESLKSTTWKFQIEKLIFLLLNFISDDPSAEFSCRLKDYNKWIDATLCKTLAQELRKDKTHPHACALSFRMDLAMIKAGHETRLPSEWLKTLPELLSAYPENYEAVQTLLLKDPHTPLQKDAIVSVPSLEKITSRIDWTTYLLTSKEKSQRDIGNSLLNECSPEEREKVTSKLMQTQRLFLEKKLDIVIPPECFNWVLLLLALGVDHSFSPQERALVPVEKDFVTKGIAEFENPTHQESCSNIFNKLFPDYSSKGAPQIQDVALTSWVNRMLGEPVGSSLYCIGLKIHSIFLQHSQKPVPLAAALLKDYPELHVKVPAIGKTIAPVLAVQGDPGSELLTELLSKIKPIDRFDWIGALLCHLRKECLNQATHLMGTLTDDEQKILWDEQSLRFLEYRLESMPRIISLFKLIKITPKTHTKFFLEWIAKLKKAKKNTHFKSFQNYLKTCSDFPVQASENKDLSNWINQIEKQLRSPPKAAPKAKPKAAPKAVKDRISASNCTEHLRKRIQGSTPKLAAEIHQEIETLLEKFGNEVPLDKLCEFYEFYYTQLEFVESKNSTTKPKGWLQLLQLIEIIKLPKKKFLINYIKDLTLIFVSLFSKPHEKIGVEKKQMSIYFQKYLELIVFRFKDKEIFAGILARLKKLPEHPACLERPIEQYLPIALSTSQTLPQLFTKAKDILEIGKYIRKRLTSKNLLEVDIGYYWLSELTKQLIEADDKKRVVLLIFGAFRSSPDEKPLNDSRADWMLHNGYSFWILRAIDCLEFLESPEDQIKLQIQVRKFFSHYRLLNEGDPKEHASNYMHFLSILFEAKKVNIDLDKQYDVITSDYVKKVLSHFFPNRDKSTNPDHIKQLAATSFLANNLKFHRGYNNAQQLISCYTELANQHCDFLKKIAQLAVESNDRAALVAFFVEYRKSKEDFINKKVKNNAVFECLRAIDEYLLKNIDLILKENLEILSKKEKPEVEDPFVAASAKARLADATQFHRYFMSLNIPQKELPRYTELLTPQFKKLKFSLVQKVGLFLKYQFLDDALWTAIISEINTADPHKIDDVLKIFEKFFSSDNEYGKVLWSSPKPTAKTIWANFVMNIVLTHCDINLEELLDVAKRVFPHIPEQDPLSTDDNHIRCTTLFMMLALVCRRQLGDSMHYLELFRENYQKYLNSISSYSSVKLGESAPLIMFNYWACASLFLNLDPNDFLRQILKNDEDGKKIKFVARLLDLLCCSPLDCRIDSLFGALNMMADNSELQGSLFCSFYALLQKAQNIRVNGSLKHDTHILKNLSEFLVKAKVDQFSQSDTRVVLNVKSAFYEMLLKHLENPVSPFLSYLINAIPPGGWLQYILHKVREVQNPSSVKWAIALIFKNFFTKFSKKELTLFFTTFYTEYKMQFVLDVPIKDREIWVDVSQVFEGRHQALLTVLDTINLADDTVKMAYIKDVYCAFALLFSTEPLISPISISEATQYFKNFVAYITQKLRTTSDAWHLLKLLVDLYSNTKMVSFPLKSLYSVNLSIQRPIKEYVQTARQQIHLANIIYRYLHSSESMSVNTGFTWLAVVFTEIKSAEELQDVLSLIFDPEFRAKKLLENPDVKDASFSKTNPDDNIKLEPWMIPLGLNYFFLKLSELFQTITRDALNKVFIDLFLRFLRLHGQTGALPVDKQWMCHFYFSGVMVRAKQHRVFETKIPVDYEAWIRSLTKNNLEILFPRRNSVGHAETSASLITFGAKLIDEIVVAEDQQSMQKCHSFYVEYFSLILARAEKGSDREFINALLNGLEAIKKHPKYAPPRYMPRLVVELLINEWLNT